MKKPDNIVEDLWNAFFEEPLKQSGLPRPPKYIEFLLKDSFIGGLHFALDRMHEYLPENEDAEVEMQVMEKIHNEIMEFKELRKEMQKKMEKDMENLQKEKQPSDSKMRKLD